MILFDKVTQYFCYGIGRKKKWVLIVIEKGEGN